MTLHLMCVRVLSSIKKQNNNKKKKKKKKNTSRLKLHQWLHFRFDE